MGEEAGPEFEKEFGGKVLSQQLQDYVQMVGQKVSQRAERSLPYEFTLVSSKVANAFALPGGKVFITAGLMRQMTNERQLAAVLGHETAHAAAGHNVQGMQRQMGADLLIRIAAKVAGEDKAQTAAAATEIAASMLTLRYSRNDEYEADKIGIRYMGDAGYNPWGMLELLTVLQNLSESDPGLLGEFFQTHPLTGKRIETVEQTIRDSEKYAAFSPNAPDPSVRRFKRMHSLLVGTMAEAD
jgi:predicted Zn-dependent protease